MIPLWLFGGGGHAKSAIDAARTSGRYQIVGILDDSFRDDGACVSGVPVMGPISEACVHEFNIEHAVIAIGNNRVRAQIAEKFGGLVEWATVVHSATYVAPNVTLGAGTVICAGAVVQPEAAIGRHVIANTSCSIGHDCVVEDFAHIAPGTNLAGGSVIGTGAFMGIGSRVIPLKRVGAWTTVGAGGVVVEDIPAGVTAVGIPARIVGASNDL